METELILGFISLGFLILVEVIIFTVYLTKMNGRSKGNAKGIDKLVTSCSGMEKHLGEINGDLKVGKVTMINMEKDIDHLDCRVSRLEQYGKRS